VSGEATSYQRLREHLSYLGLTTAAENLSLELDRALKDKLSTTQVRIPEQLDHRFRTNWISHSGVLDHPAEGGRGAVGVR